MLTNVQIKIKQLQMGKNGRIAGGGGEDKIPVVDTGGWARSLVCSFSTFPRTGSGTVSGTETEVADEQEPIYDVDDDLSI